jgi:hypothetical protein
VVSDRTDPVEDMLGAALVRRTSRTRRLTDRGHPEREDKNKNGGGSRSGHQLLAAR